MHDVKIHSQSSRKPLVCLTKPPNFVSLLDSMSDNCQTKNQSRKMPRQGFGVTWSSMDEDCTYLTYIPYILSSVYRIQKDKYSKKAEPCYLKYSKKAEPCYFCAAFFVSAKNFQTVEQLSINISDFAKTAIHDALFTCIFSVLNLI